MLSGKIRPATEIVSSYMNGAFSFDISNYLRNRMLRRNRDQHMDMIRLQMTLLDSALPLLGQGPETPLPDTVEALERALSSDTLESRQRDTCIPTPCDVDFVRRSCRAFLSTNFERFTDGRLSLISGTVKL